MSDERSRRVIDTWIWPTNVRPFAESIGRWVGYAFDESDWSALDHGLATTDRDAESWYTYRLDGDPVLDLVVAQNIGDEPVSVRVLATDAISDELRFRIAAAADVLNTYRVG